MNTFRLELEFNEAMRQHVFVVFLNEEQRYEFFTGREAFEFIAGLPLEYAPHEN